MRETGKPQNFSGASTDEPADLAPGMDWLYLEYCHVHDELLDAKAREVAVQRILEQFDRTLGADSASRGPAGDGDGVAKFRSQARAKISCGDTRYRRWNRSGVARGDTFHFWDGRASVVCCSWHLQRLRPFLFTARRFPDGICGGVRDRPGEFDRQPGWICRTVRNGLDQPEK